MAIPGTREGSIGTKFYFRLGVPPFLSVKRNDKKILEHRFGRDDESRSSFWTWY